MKEQNDIKNSSIMGIMAIMAKMTSLKVLIQKLEVEIDSYNMAILTDDKKKEEETFTGISLLCYLILMKKADIDPVDLVSELDKLDRMREIFKPGL